MKNYINRNGNALKKYYSLFTINNLKHSFSKYQKKDSINKYQKILNKKKQIKKKRVFKKKKVLKKKKIRKNFITLPKWVYQDRIMNL